MGKLILIIIIVICSWATIALSGLPFAVWCVSVPAGLAIIAKVKNG